jgi:hypothetical protein
VREIVEASVWKKHFHLPGKCQSAPASVRSNYSLPHMPLLARKRPRRSSIARVYGLRHFRVIAAPPGAQPGLISETL